MAYLRAIAFISTLTIALIFVAPAQWLARRLEWRVQDRIQRLFCRVICAVIGVQVKARGRLPGDSPRFVVANHVSWTDIIALSSLHPFVFLAKSEVASWPVLGLLAKLQGTVFVERGARTAIPQVNDALTTVLRKGRDVFVFAEGTSSDGSQVLRFRPAHFAALPDLRDGPGAPGRVTLAPVAIFYTDRGARTDVGWYGDMTFLPHLWSLMKRGGVCCHIVCGDAVEVGATDRKSLAAATEASVRDLLAEAARDFESPASPRR